MNKPGGPKGKPVRQETVETLTKQIKDSSTLIVTDFSGLNVLKMTEFRRRLRATGSQYVVVKNTLAQRALAANKISALDDHLSGNTGIVFAGSDPMAAAKGTYIRSATVSGTMGPGIKLDTAGYR